MNTQPTGAGLFNLRDLSDDTLCTLHETIRVRVGPKAETDLFCMVRRILIERGRL